MRTHAERRRMNNLKGGALVTLGAAGFLLLMFWALPTFFSYVDCNTARDYIAFVEQCEASETCTVRDFEHKRVEGYYRLEIKRCNREED